MSDRYLYIDPTTGRPTQRAATVTSVGAGNAGDIVGLDSSGRISSTMMPVGIGAATISCIASENLSAGDLVNIFNNGGTRAARRANATDSTRPANGYVLDPISSAASGLVYTDGHNTAIPIGSFDADDVGLLVFTSTSAGQVTTTPPTDAGNLVQQVGYIVGVGASTITIDFKPGDEMIA